jgi:hypothetical protein
VADLCCIRVKNSQVEDSKWSGGPSANQVHAISKFYSMFATHKGSGQGMMPISGNQKSFFFL